MAVENTHNFGGGTVQPLDRLTRAARLADAHGLALAPRRRPAVERARGHRHPAGRHTAALFDTVSVCFSKGLGAPVGSLLVSSAERITEARVWRKRYGGGMRQVGVLAAAGLYALDHHIDRLAEDHAHAQRSPTACAEVAPDGRRRVPRRDQHRAAAARRDPLAVSRGVAAAARGEGVLVSALGPRFVRVVTHLEIGDADAKQAADVLARLLASTRTWT